MTLYLFNAGNYSPWKGEPIDGVRHPLNIETLWSDDDLAAAGLFKAVDPGIPDGKIATGFRVEVIDGVLTIVYDLQDAPSPPIDPATLPVTSQEIAQEVERRIAMPLTVQGLSVDSFQINMDAPSQRNLQGLASVGMYLSAVAPGTITAFRDYANVQHDLLPSDLVAMGLQVAGRIQAVYEASWALKAIDPIPKNYADDSYWP